MKSAFTRHARCLLVALAFVSATSSAVTISPVLVQLSPARPVASITVSNSGGSPVSFQAEVLAWSQPNGTDRYDESDDLMVVPPIADIPPGGTQIFRVALRTPSTGPERAYRLIFDDITVLAAPASSEVSLNIRVNHNLPVFVSGGDKPQPGARIAPCDSVVPTADKRGCIRIVNEGNRYLQVKSITLEAQGWHQDIPAKARVLAGAWRDWSFDFPRQVRGEMHVKADTSAGSVASDLTIPVR